MSIAWKRAIAWIAGGLVLGIGGVYAELVRELHARDPVSLLACMEVEQPWFGWTCKQVLTRSALTPDQVVALNTRAGALFPLLATDTAEAEEMLELFISRGVDINAGDVNAGHWTALHTIVAEGNVDRVKLLLAHGAKGNVGNDDGESPLDMARRMAALRPGDPNRQVSCRS